MAEQKPIGQRIRDDREFVEWVNDARNAQQAHEQKHDVQLEISDRDPGDEDDAKMVS